MLFWLLPFHFLSSLLYSIDKVKEALYYLRVEKQTLIQHARGAKFSLLVKVILPIRYFSKGPS
jgi:hypothetical protein